MTLHIQVPQRMIILNQKKNRRTLQIIAKVIFRIGLTIASQFRSFFNQEYIFHCLKNVFMRLYLLISIFSSIPIAIKT